MILVVDANILFAALIKPGLTRTILLLSEHELFAPEFSVYEFKKHLEELENKTGLEKDELNELFEELIESSGIKLIVFEEFENKKEEAKKISPDIDDSAYIALALHLGCGIWSNDKELKKQKEVKIITTKELFEEMKKEY
ncbi:PIN domain-containing protein [Candidatus Micrarchaeota archaeon]|nr:PIN domain-containing protein [Candidatus Micrarchaeota archaeon]